MNLVRIFNPSKKPLVVNVWECDKPYGDTYNVERHDLSPGQCVNVKVNGWSRGVTVMDADSGE